MYEFVIEYLYFIAMIKYRLIEKKRKEKKRYNRQRSSNKLST